MPKRRMLGLFSVTLGIFLFLNGLGAMFNLEVLSLMGLTANVLLAPLWALLVAIDLLRHPVGASPGID